LSTIVSAAGYDRPLKTVPRSNWLSIVLISGVIVAYILLALIVGHKKAPDADEALFADPALNLITNGSMGTRILETAGTPWKGMNQRTYWMPPLYMLAEAVWFSVFGFSLWSLRALSTAWGLLVLASWWVIMNALFRDRRLATLTVVLTALDNAFIHFGSQGRMDMMSASLGLVALAAYVNIRERNLFLAVMVSQALVVASGLTHPVGGVVWWSGLLLFTLYLDRQRLILRHAWAALVPYVIGALAWGVYILRSPSDFVAQFIGNIFVHDRMGSISIWRRLGMEGSTLVLNFFGITAESSPWAAAKLIIPFLYAIAIIGGFLRRDIRRSPGFGLLLSLATLSFLLIAVADHGQRPHYLVHILICLPPLLAVSIRSHWMTGHIPRAVLLAVTAAFLTLQLSRTGHLIWRNSFERNFAPVSRFLDAERKPSDLIMGSAELAFSVGFTPQFIDDPSLGYHSGKTPDLIVLGERYEVYAVLFRRRDPMIVQHARSLIEQEYCEIYNQARYRVYRRKPC